MWPDQSKYWTNRSFNHFTFIQKHRCLHSILRDPSFPAFAKMLLSTCRIMDVIKGGTVSVSPTAIRAPTRDNLWHTIEYALSRHDTNLHGKLLTEGSLIKDHSLSVHINSSSATNHGRMGPRDRHPSFQTLSSDHCQHSAKTRHTRSLAIQDLVQ